MAKVSVADFVRQVRQEVSRVTWPTRKETLVSTMMVCVVVMIASVFFLAVDMLVLKGVQFVLGLGV